MESLDPRVIANLRAIADEEDEDFFGQMVNLFLRQLRADVALLRDAVQRPGPAAALIAHAIKGSAQNFGADRLSALCERVETACETDGAKILSEYLVDLETESQRVRWALEKEKQKTV